MVGFQAGKSVEGREDEERDAERTELDIGAPSALSYLSPYYHLWNGHCTPT
jgi:hypothetical protein